MEKDEETIMDYYTQLFSSSNTSDFSELINAVEPKVSHEMNNTLTREFNDSKVKTVLNQMYPLISLGPNGMPPLFFQHFWPTISNVVTKTVLDFLNSGISPPNFNDKKDKEDAMWLQRSRINWFQSRDRNSRYFHSKASARFQKNLIFGLMDSNECWQEDMEKDEETIVDYYMQLFSSSSTSDFSELINAVEPKVSHEMNNMLTREFNDSEVKTVLNQMCPLISPSPDGMPPLLFQHFWPTIGNVVTKTVLDFLNSSIFPPNFNDIHIVLIPKVKEPKRITDYRPISLCNVVYKLASQTIANRLKKVLPSIISDTQSAFVHGILITDNVLVAFETMHHIN